MNKFTDVYLKAKNVVEKETFSPEWKNFLLNKCLVKTLLGPNGLDSGNSNAPDFVRKKIKEGMRLGKTSSGDVILNATKNEKGTGSVEEKAATIKMLNHLHRTTKKGGQDVWIYSAPKAYSTWIFDEIKGTPEAIKSKLDKEEEIFSEDERKWMSSSLGIAKKISEDAKVKLGSKKSCEAMIKRWFLDESCGEDELNNARAKLIAGFNKISVSCGASSLVFADYPDWRAQRNKYFGAAFRGGEGGGFPVVYLEGAFTRLTGNTGKQWLCAQTIIHELSHHDISTQDHRYDHHGLKPNKASFPYAKAIENADSWGYFALNLAGYLSQSDFENVWK